jgi:hypothetical protein
VGPRCQWQKARVRVSREGDGASAEGDRPVGPVIQVPGLSALVCPVGPTCRRTRDVRWAARCESGSGPETKLPAQVSFYSFFLFIFLSIFFIFKSNLNPSLNSNSYGLSFTLCLYS